jgi:hypothetical protein
VHAPVTDPIARRPGMILALLNLILGTLLLAGDPLRTSSPSFAGPKALMPIALWGLLFLLGGLICASAANIGRLGAVAVAAGGGIHAFWATCLWMSAAAEPRAALTGIGVYAWVALLHILTGARLARRVR